MATTETTDDIIDFLHLHFPGFEGLPAKSDAAELKPINKDVPYVTRTGDTLSCTMGNWVGEPTSYKYQWKRGTANVGEDSDTYTVTGADAGATMTCVVSATNAAGTTTAPASNGVAIAASQTRTAHDHKGKEA
jgi:hypothetical protein